MRLAVEQQTSFARGMNDTAAPTEYRPDECELLVNGRISFDGQAVQRRGGSVKLHTSALDSGSQGYGAIEFYKAAGTKQLITFFGDRMYNSEDDGVTWTSETTGLTEAYWSSVIMREGAANVLCSSNGGTSSYQWDGDTWATISNIPNSVKYLAVFGNRLWAAGHSGIIVVASAVGDIDTWATPGGLSIQAQTHDGDTDITGLFALGSVLLVFKTDSVGYIEGYGFNTLEVETGARGISRSVGCIAHRTIRAVGDQGVMWLSKRGLEYYELGGRITLVTRPIQNFMDGVNWAQLASTPGIANALWWPQRHSYMCAIPVTGSQNDYVIEYRPPHEDHPPALMLHRYVTTDDDTLYVDANGYLNLSTTSDRDEGLTVPGQGYLEITTTGGQFMQVDASGYLDFASAEHDHAALFLASLTAGRLDAVPVSCGYDGFVRQLESGNKDNAAKGGVGGADITMQLVTRPFLFGDPIRRKRSRQLRIASKQANAATVNVRAKIDGVDQTSHALSFAASNKPIVKKARINGKGAAHALEITTTDDVKISIAEISAEVLRDAGR